MAEICDKVINFGNSVTNSVWNQLLGSCPVKATADRITLDSQVFSGQNLGAYFIWPRSDSNAAMVGVVTGTGLTGMKSANANQYFAAGSGFADYMIFSRRCSARVLEELKPQDFLAMIGVADVKKPYNSLMHVAGQAQQDKGWLIGGIVVRCCLMGRANISCALFCSHSNQAPSLRGSPVRIFRP